MANVQLSKYSDFNKKNFLVVDDFPEFRTAIKRMVEAFGATDVDTSSNGEDAIAKIKSKTYHVIMCDYNLGEGKDGQQILEEAKYAGALNESQVFILLTAENTAEMVMGALEYEPDGYLVKPFTKEMVHQRLMQCVVKKKELMDIYKAIEGKDPGRAIQICDQKISKGGKVVLPCLKIKGKLLIKEQKYQEARDLYSSLLETRRLPWVLMGLGQSYFYEEMYEDALEQFQAIIEDSEVNVEGYDWVAKTQLAMGIKDEAQETLERAVQLSSKAILRQQRLGDLAFENDAKDIAEKAYRAAVNLGRHSCYRRTTDYLRYGELLMEKALGAEHGRVSLKAGQDAVSVLENLSNIYRNDKKVQAPACTMLCLAMHVAGRKDKAKIMLKKALAYVETDHVKMESEMMVKLGEALVMSGETEKGEAMIEEYSKSE